MEESDGKTGRQLVFHGLVLFTLEISHVLDMLLLEDEVRAGIVSVGAVTEVIVIEPSEACYLSVFVEELQLGLVEACRC